MSVKNHPPMLLKPRYMLVIFNLMTLAVSAQLINTPPAGTERADTNKREKVEIMDYLPPLNLMIDSALKNSPEMDYFDALVESAEYDIVLERKSWSQDLSGNVGYSWSYGNQILDNNLGLLDENQTRTSTFTTVSMRLPLSTWYTRGDRIKRAEAIRKSRQAQYEQSIREVREKVINLYSEILLLQEQLEIIAEAKETSDLMMQTAEQRFRDGEIGLEELGQVTDLKAQYASKYAELKTAFSTTYQALERIVGVPFSKFKTETYIGR